MCDLALFSSFQEQDHPQTEFSFHPPCYPWVLLGIGDIRLLDSEDQRFGNQFSFISNTGIFWPPFLFVLFLKLFRT